MAKKDKGEAKAETKRTFVVADLAEALDKEAFEVRALLRRAEIEKTEGKYTWSGQKEFDSVVKQIKALGTKSKAEPEDEKPAKGGKKSAPENKAEAKAPEGKKRPKPAGSK